VEGDTEFYVNLDVRVIMPSYDDALDSLDRSGIFPGAMIGEAVIVNVERPEEG
jgi:hypothetical protein